ncbi:hypothetical protein AVEN_254134-1 [Araneus ventricosus]|uniref:Endonuclease/exonuclease/phosphatase domain-containing protein n=1 Tax=Araneus ventricosus TaxID=182803 RepID=A0A4Y2BYF3_ARAVE|nr:hypothetical protein AVEN_254134-1 [Araneus ventricosus]
MINPDILFVQEQCNNNNEIPRTLQSWKICSCSNQEATILIPSAQLKPDLLATKFNMVALKIQTSSYSITIISLLLLTITKRPHNSPGDLQLTRGKNHRGRVVRFRRHNRRVPGLKPDST